MSEHEWISILVNLVKVVCKFENCECVVGHISRTAKNSRERQSSVFLVTLAANAPRRSLVESCRTTESDVKTILTSARKTGLSGVTCRKFRRDFRGNLKKMPLLTLRLPLQLPLTALNDWWTGDVYSWWRALKTWHWRPRARLSGRPRFSTETDSPDVLVDVVSGASAATSYYTMQCYALLFYAMLYRVTLLISSAERSTLQPATQTETVRPLAINESFTNR